MQETKEAPKLEDIKELLLDGELEHLPPVYKMDDMGLEILLGKVIGRINYILDHEEIDASYLNGVHKGMGFVNDSVHYFKSEKKRKNLADDVLYTNSRYEKRFKEFAESDSGVEAAAEFYKMLCVGKSAIEQDKKGKLREKVWGENADSDTIRGDNSDLFSLAMSYLKDGLFSFASGEKDKAKESVSMANEELKELSDLLKSRSGVFSLAEEYARFHKEVSAIGFDIENYMNSMTDKGSSLPFCTEVEPDFKKDNSVKAVLADFYSTPLLPLQFNRLDVSKEDEPILARTIIESYINGLYILASHLEQIEQHDSSEEKSETPLERMADMSKDKGTIFYLKDSVVKSLSGCENIPVLDYYTSRIKRDYDVDQAWDILKGAVPAFADAEEIGFADLCRNLNLIDKEDIVKKSVNFAGFDTENPDSFTEKLGKSFSYINANLR